MKFPLLSVLLFIFFACNTVENASKESSFISQSQDTIQDSCCIYPVPQFPFEFIIKDKKNCVNIRDIKGFVILQIKISRTGKIKSVKLKRLDLYTSQDTISYNFYFSHTYPAEIKDVYYALRKYSKKSFKFKAIRKVRRKSYVTSISVRIGCD